MQCILDCFWDEEYSVKEVTSILKCMYQKKLKISGEWTMCSDSSRVLFKRCLKEFKSMENDTNCPKEIRLVKLWSLIAMIYVGPNKLMS